MENEILNGIVKDVEEQVGLVIDQINYEIAQMHDEQITLFKEGLQKEQETYLDKELDDLKMLAVTKSSKAKLKTKRDLLALREEMVEALFTDLKLKLDDFVNSDDYAKMIAKNLEELEVDGGTLVIREEDKHLYEKFLKNHQDVKCEVSRFKFGGFRYVTEKRDAEYDFSLDSRYDEQISWFKDNSGFTL